MFSLIITIISIALVAALALATLYYGGDAFNQGKAGADASRLINEGQQVNAAVTLAAATGVATTDLASLVSGNVLSQLPASFATAGTTTIASGIVTTTNGVTAEVCTEVQKRAGIASPHASPAAPVAGQIFGCTTDGTDYSFYYRF